MLLIFSRTFPFSVAEFGLATAPLRNIGRVLSQNRLMDATSVSQRYSSTRIPDNQIFKPRRQLALESNELPVQTIYGRGYRLIHRRTHQREVRDADV
ncbi:winged helix-turn-helix domain-containing protein [Variovorax sp. PAMC28562]|uniref:winged helix-turn-helix domain-containing protein n=1 Tax=Variovorax sp. PAMC28562 TaxID=2762323 RepID=UPI00164E759A|nr:winged helix-turn-helix domain-containing protein [Variovorax sp. PAMC28562]